MVRLAPADSTGFRAQGQAQDRWYLNFVSTTHHIFHDCTLLLQEYADLISGLTAFSAETPLDPLWVAEFLAIIQCRIHQFPPAALAKLLSAVADMPGAKPGATWMKLAVTR